MNSKRLLKGISKLILLMNDFSKRSIETKKELLNNPKMIEYLFNKSIHKHSDVNTAIKSCTDYVKDVKLDSVDITSIEGDFFVIQEFREKYKELYSRYRNCLKQYNYLIGSNLDFENKLPYIPKMSKSIDKIADILDGYRCNFITKWSFFLEEERHLLNRRIPYSFHLYFEVDFYGCVINNMSRMIQFAVLYDSGNLTYHDVLKEYYLCAMNIHVLRLNSKLNFKNEIKKFLKKIIKYDEYIIMNSLLSRSSFRSSRIKDLLDKFYDSYQYNHINYLKYYSGKDNTPADFIHNYSEAPADNSYIVTDDVLKTIIKNLN